MSARERTAAPPTVAVSDAERPDVRDEDLHDLLVTLLFHTGR